MANNKVAKAQKARKPKKQPNEKRPVKQPTKRPPRNESDSSESESESEAMSDVEVTFQLYNMAEQDYHAVKQYFASAFGATEHGVDLVNLTTFVSEDLADHVGTCIKTEGEESDPFGFLTGLPISLLQASQEGAFDPARKTLAAFFGRKLEGFDADAFFSEKGNVFLAMERLINVPVELTGPLFRQFTDDWHSAARDEPAHFASPKQVLLMTPTYREVDSKLDRELGLVDGGKSQRGFQTTAKGFCFYYPEMEDLERFASQSWTFAVNTGHNTSDSRRAFSEAGIEPGRRAFLLTWEKFAEFVTFLEQKTFE